MSTTTVVPISRKTPRRPLRARRLAIGHDQPMEYSAPSPAPTWLVVGTGLVGAAVIVELVIGLVLS